MIVTRRAAWRFGAAVFAVAVLLNFGWEFLQCRLYLMPDGPASLWWHCLRASLGDGALVLLVWMIGWVVFGSPRWAGEPGVRGYALMITSGLAIGAFVEWISVHVLNRWAYGPYMPEVPLLRIGVLPLLQMLLLPPLVFWLASLPTRAHGPGGASAPRDRFFVWLLTAVILGLSLFVADRDRRPLDDPDLAFQRPGFLDPHMSAFPAPPVSEGLTAAGRRSVIFFVRPQQLAALRRSLAASGKLSAQARLAVIVAGPVSGRLLPPIAWISDPAGRMADLFRVRRPRDGGPPVGYAIVDSSGRVRYPTLDPQVADRLKEVRTMLAATP